MNTFGKTKTINLIVENSKYKQYGNDFAKLQEKLSGNHITLYPDKTLGITYTHAKTFVGDHTRAIQTANLNRSSFLDNKEHFFLSEQENIKNNLLTLFELDREKIQSSDRL